MAVTTKPSEAPAMVLQRKPRRVKKLNLTRQKSTAKKGSKTPIKKAGGSKRTRIVRPPISEFGIDAVNLSEKMKNPDN